MTVAARLQAIVAVMPEGASITLHVDTVKDWLRAEPEITRADYTLEELRAAEFPRKSLSTLRSWCVAKRFPNAYKLGRTWMVPRADVAALKQAERDRLTMKVLPMVRRRTKKPNTAAWRKVMN